MPQFCQSASSSRVPAAGFPWSWLTWSGPGGVSAMVAPNSPASKLSCQPKFLRRQDGLQSSETRPAPWRSIRPASSSSSKTVRTMPAEQPDIRMRSSTAVGVGPSKSTMRDRSPVSGSLRRASAPSGSSAGNSVGCPRIGRSTEITSSASVTRLAPCLRRWLLPSARGSRGEPGTAKTSRPCSSASRAVIREPERFAASTTTIPAASPEMSRLRRGKSWARGCHPSGISERSPCARMALAKVACSGG